MKQLTYHSPPIDDKKIRLVVGDLSTRSSIFIYSRNRKVSKEIVPTVIQYAHCLVNAFLSSSPVRDLGLDMTTTMPSAFFSFKARVWSVTKFHAFEYVGFHLDAFHLGTLVLWEDSGLGEEGINNCGRNTADRANLFRNCFALLGTHTTIQTWSNFILPQGPTNLPSIALHLPLLLWSKAFKDSCKYC